MYSFFGKQLHNNLVHSPALPSQTIALMILILIGPWGTKTNNDNQLLAFQGQGEN